MMVMMKRLIAGFMVWTMAVLVASGAFGQEIGAPETGITRPVQQPKFYAWAGAPPSPAECDKRLAKVKAMIEVDANYAQAEADLHEIWVMSTASRGFKGQGELLVEVAVARANLYKLLGQNEKAIEATQNVLLKKQDFEPYYADHSQFAQAGKPMAMLAASAVNDPRLASLRTKLETVDSDSDSLNRIVRHAFDRGDYDLIVEIGEPAQRTFVDYILTEANTMPAVVNQDPLLHLLRINEQRAAELLLANLDAGGYLWKRRIIRAMNAGGVLRNSGTWSNERPFVCLEPEWLSMLEALLSTPETALQCVHLVGEPFIRDQISPGMQRALVRGIENYELEFTNALLQAIDHGGVVESARPIFEALAKLSAPQVKRFAARALANYESSPTLKALAADPDPIVRAAVAGTLQSHGGHWVYLDSSNGGWRVRLSSRSYQPVLTPDDRKLLAQLASDPKPKVRRIAAEALTDLRPPLDDAIYLKLASDSDSTVRYQSALFTAVSSDLRSKILTQLAASGDKHILSCVDEQLSEASLASNPTPYLGAIELRLFDSRNPMESAGYNVARELMKTPTGLQAFASWTLAHSEFSRYDLLRDLLHNQGYKRILDLDDATLAGVFVLFCESKIDNAYPQQQVVSAIQQARPARRAAMRLVVADANVGSATRLLAAELAALDGGEEFANALMSLIRDPYWKTNAANDDDLEALHRAVRDMPSGEINPFVLRVIRDKEIPSKLASTAAIPYSQTGPLGREVTLAAIDRWFAPGGRHLRVLSKAIRHLAALPEDATVELLEAAASHVNYTEEAVETIIALRRQELLPILERCLSPEWIEGEEERQEISRDAARGLSSFQSDEAARILLSGFSSSDNVLRSICMSGLDHLEAIRKRTEQWAKIKEEKPSKESALSELLGMLDDKNIEIRTQAIRGIATFGAIEYLPTLIRLLKDPNAHVVQAARQAIDTLSAAASSKREG